MRLAVNQFGDRQDDPATVHQVNVLTVVASESYKDFVSALQKDISSSLSERPKIADEAYFTGKMFRTETGDVPVTPQLAKLISRYLVENDYTDTSDRITSTFHDAKESGTLAALPTELAPYTDQVFSLISSVFSDAQLPEIDDERAVKSNPLNSNFEKKEFQALWQRINHKAIYTVHFETDELIGKCVRASNKELDVTSLQYTIQIIEETKSLPELENRCRTLQSDVQSYASKMATFCGAICDDRDTICRLRKTNVASINAEINTVRLNFKKSANHSRRDGFQESYREDAGGIFKYVNKFAGDEPYEKLRSLFLQLSEIAIEEQSWEVTDLIIDAKFVEFLKVFDDDDVSIELLVGQAGFIPIQNLSAGQRCTAVFPLLLRNSKGPLVIDQPEDNLDNRYIADVIAPDLLKKKMQQQYVATSHNANLVVLTDSDLVIHADSDGRRGSVVSGGFFACSESKICRSILDVLDGGKQALEARQRKYGLRLT